jgi:hypothetical protein
LNTKSHHPERLIKKSVQNVSFLKKCSLMMSIEVAQTLVIIIEANNLFLNYYFLEWEGSWYFIYYLLQSREYHATVDDDSPNFIPHHQH